MNLAQHRTAHSQEFAIDIVGSDFSTSNHKTSDSVLAYSIYNKEVIAIGSGKVVEVGTDFPDSLMDNPKNYSDDSFKQLCHGLIPKIGIKNTILGNYMIIQHAEAEYSLYAHLKEKSIRTKVGSKVEQGDLIARVGNTGNSTEPHLHFQLIDSSDIFEANGLPVMFKNVPINNLNQHYSKANSLISSDYFFTSIE